MKRRPRDKVLKAVQPNAGIAVAYRKKLQAAIEEMHCSVLHWVRAQYRKTPPRLAQDAPAAKLDDVMAELTDRWQSKFDNMAGELAKFFAKKVYMRSDLALRKILRDGGITVKFQMTPVMRDVFEATVGENVGLIRSIPQQYLGEVQGLVMRSVSAGRDLGFLTRGLLKRYAITQKRAALIAIDQNNKATSAMTRVRQEKLGLKAVWKHSRAGREPRPTHVAMDGKTYDPAKGMFDSDPRVKRFIWPGELINCFPGDMTVGLETGPTRLWRTFFDGPMVHLKVRADLLKGTLNHPILTGRGWIPLGSVDRGDQVVCMVGDQREMVNDNEKNRKTTFAELFESHAIDLGYMRRDGRRFNFYGDLPDGDVDEIIIGHNQLPLHGESSPLQEIGDLSLTKSDLTVFGLTFGGAHQITPPLFSGGANNTLPLLQGRLREPRNVGIASSPHHAGSNQDRPDVRGAMSREAQMQGDGCRSHPVPVERDDLLRESIPVAPFVDFDDADSTELFAQFVRITANRKRGVFQFGAGLYELRSVGDKSIRDFSGHVFTLQTRVGYYSVGGASIQAKNCRCTSRSIVPGFE